MQTLQRKISLLNVTEVTLYTGNNNSSKCSCKCPCCTQNEREGVGYQGTIEQAEELLESFPNLRQLYILGNPDASVDAEFCNKVMKMAIAKNVRVCFSTSGVGGVKILEKLLNDISAEKVDYISFSIDSINPEKMSMLKGIKYPWEKAIKGIQWAFDRGYRIKIQPTLWSCNYEDVESIIDYFYAMGIKWFTFHVGSLECGIDLPTHRHLTSEQLRNVHEQINRLASEYSIVVKCPTIYPELGNNNSSKWYCMKEENQASMQAYFTEDGIIATPTPIANACTDKMNFRLEKNVFEYQVKMLHKADVCPFSFKLTGENIPTYCRYISRIWQS